MLTRLKVKKFYSRPLWVEADYDADLFVARKVSYEIYDIAEVVKRRIKIRSLEKLIFIRSIKNDFKLG